MLLLPALVYVCITLFTYDTLCVSLSTIVHLVYMYSLYNAHTISMTFCISFDLPYASVFVCVTLAHNLLVYISMYVSLYLL